MYTQCPKCRTIFEIDEAALQAALGIVRCGQCAERFDALRTLSGELPDGPDATLPDHDPEQLTPVLTEAVPASGCAPDGNSPATAIAAPAAAERATPPADEPTAPRADAWGACALVASVADVPPEAVCGNPAWLVTTLPRQQQPSPAAVIAFSPVAIAAAATPFPRASSEPAVAEAHPGRAGAKTGSPMLPEVSADVAVPAPGEFTAETNHAGAARPASPGESSAACMPPPLLLLAHEDAGTPAGDAADVPGTGAAESGAASSAVVASAGPDEPAGGASVEPVPTYIPPRAPRVRRSSVLFAIGCVALALVLAAQIGWARRAALVRDPATRAWALGACAKLDCRLPPIRDVAKLELLSRDVRSDPETTGALIVTATLRNDAAFRQPWPVVAIRLTDLDDNVIAMRRFRPAEYVPGRARRDAGLAPGATAAVAFEVTDPGARASGFRFSLE